MKTVKKVFTVSVVFTTILWAVGFAAFVPVANATAPVAGDLIKASGPAVYYYAADGKRYVFPNQTTYMTWYSDFSSVNTVTDDELAAISIGGNVTVRPGTKLVKITTDPKVYAVTSGGTLHWVETATLAETLYGSGWASRVVDVPDAFFVNYTTGDSVSTAVHPDGSLVTYEGAADVYLVEGGVKRKVADETAFNANRFQWDNVLTIADTVTYSNGTDLAGAETDLTTTAGEGVTPGAAGTLTVSLASDSPAAGNVAKNSSINYTKLTLTAGASDVSVTKIYATRYGLSGTADVENVKLVDMDGIQWGNTAGNLNSLGQAMLVFTTALSIPANTSVSYYLRAGVPLTGSTTANSVGFGVASADDVTTSATVSGSFPVTGNYMTIVGTTIGTASVGSDGTTVDSTPDAGDTDVLVSKFKVMAGSTEGILIENMTFLESGTASLSDSSNIELWSVTNNESLGTVASWNAEGKAAFTNLNLSLTKGQTHRFKLLIDVISGAGLTVNSDLVDGSDVLVTVKGATYGFYITPTQISSWDGLGTAQTINAGSLTVGRATTSPATGNVTEADNQVLTVFDYEAKGEEVIVSSTTVTLTVAGQADGADFINCTLKDADGVIAAGPQDSTDSTDTVVFSDTYIVPVGVNQYTFECTIYDSDADDWGGGSNDTVIAGIAGAGSLTAKGYSTNTTIAAGGSFAVNGNTQTIKFGTLAAVTLTTPAQRSVVPGVQDLIWMTGSLSAANSGEDMIVETIIIEDTYVDTGAADTDGISVIDNMEIWADLDGNGSYETKVSDTENPTGTGTSADYTQTFTLDPTITVPKDSFIKVALYADLATGADGTGSGDTHELSFDTAAASVVSSGSDTGTSVSTTPSGAGQKFAVAANGALQVSVDSSSPTDYAGTTDHLLEGNAAKQTLGVFRLTETSAAEDLELDSFLITDDGSNIVVGDWYLYASERADGGSVSEPVATAVGTSAVTFYIPDGVVKVPANDSILLTVKGDVADVDGTTVAEEDTVEVVVNDETSDVVMTGLSSGGTINGASGGTDKFDAATFVALSSVPTVAYADGWTDAYSKSLSPLTRIAKIGITAGAKDITFESSGAIAMFSLQIAGSASGGDAGTESVTFKDDDGNVLEVVAAEIDNGSVTVQVDLVFATKGLTVPANTTKYIEVTADTAGYNTVGDNLRTWLDDVAADIVFSVDTDNGTYDFGNILNRGDQHGASFSK